MGIWILFLQSTGGVPVRGSAGENKTGETEASFFRFSVAGVRAANAPGNSVSSDFALAWIVKANTEIIQNAAALVNK
jgi:hypothetical protein